MAPVGHAKATEADAILLVSLSLFDEVGGVQKFNQRVLTALIGYAPSIVVIALRDSQPRDLGPSVRYLPCAGNRWTFLRLYFAEILRARFAAILFAHINVAPLSLAVRALCPATPTALFVHGIEVWNEAAYRRRRWFEPMLIRRTIDVVISVSAFTQRVMSREFSLPANMFRRLSNAIDLDETPSSSPARTSDGMERIALLSVSRLDEAYKGIGQVLCAVAQLRSRFTQMTYTVIGQGKLATDLKALAKALAIEDVVRFSGEVSDADLEAAYRQADIFVLPSTREGFGIVFLEAWKNGLPVICGDADASPEVVVDGESGIVVDPNDVAALAAAITRLGDDRALARRMAERGMARIAENFAMPIFVSNFRSLLDDLRQRVRE